MSVRNGKIISIRLKVQAFISSSLTFDLQLTLSVPALFDKLALKGIKQLGPNFSQSKEELQRAHLAV